MPPTRLQYVRLEHAHGLTLLGDDPATMHTNLLNRFQYRIAADLVQLIGRLIHTFRLGSGTRSIGCQDRGSRRIVPAVD